MSSTRSLFYTLLIAVMLVIVYFLGFGTHMMLAQRQAAAASAMDLKVFWEAANILNNEFLGTKPDPQKRIYGAVKGMVQTYSDPYTVFVEPQPRSIERDDLRGEFGGIGTQIALVDGHWILHPQADKSAAQAGILDGDELLQIEDKPINAQTDQQTVVSLIRGPIGSKVRILVRHIGAAESKMFTLTRERIETPTVEHRMDEVDPSLGYIALHLFGERSTQELKDALQDLRSKGMRRLVLDLRHNPGGLVDTAVDVTSQFISDGVVLYEEKNDATEKFYPVKGGGTALDVPMVVLVDAATASAAEIVAGALQDKGRAQLVGEKTFGKGSVQLVHDLSDGSSLHVTVSRWLTPARHPINGTGLKPDVESKRVEGKDTFLDTARTLLSKAEVK